MFVIWTDGMSLYRENMDVRQASVKEQDSACIRGRGGACVAQLVWRV